MKTILVIEDERFIRESICDVLELEGYQTLAAANGLVGIELAQTRRPDLILCDVTMPEMDGYEVLSILQKNEATNAIPFVFLTAKTTRADLRRGMNLGADDYLVKPCTAAELLNAINTRFEKQAVVQTKTEEQLKSLRNNIAQFLPHELYTPLNGIIGLSEVLSYEYDTIERSEIQELAESIRTSALRLHHLMQNFLLYTKLELIASSPEQLQLLSTHTARDPNSIIEYAAQQVAQSVDRLNDLQFNLYTSGKSEISIRITESYLYKIVTELVGNALKFSNLNTSVVIQTFIQNDQFCLAITDQGRGMTAEQIAKLGAYMQFDRQYYEQQGSGLGLIISKRITELNGGKFEINSTPAQFTTVQASFHIVADM